ncbi:amidohydrolase family protein [Microbulbifer litoralis]|uniref:amidohydrolase family protein n=1 Tax=Microbulbifer litoralis TaxID=2933965 RepID=UPI002028D80B|nr:amidohydrolase family protein [Microbulbifer sp. GX H0434]
MKIVWLVCVAALLVACGRPDGAQERSSSSAPAAEPQQSDPEQKALHLPGVERLLDLRGGRTPADYVQAVKKFMRENPDLQVIVGKGWDAAAFGATQPHKAQLDQVSDFVPIVLISRDHKSIWTNSEGLAAAGINTDTPDPPGGTIEKDEGGLPNGLVRGAAVELLERIIPRSDGSGELEADNPRHDQPDTE